MKTIKYISGFAVVALLLAFVACDKIKDGDRLIDQGVKEIKSKRCVLLEDYTGVKCVNCPKAAEATKLLKSVNGDNLVVVSLHPMGHDLTVPFSPLDQDLRTEEAKVYAEYYKIGNGALPQGVINRKYGPESDWNAWGGYVKDILDDEESDYVNLLVTAQLSGTDIKVDVKGDFKKDYPDDGAINVIVMIVEDNIQVRQQVEGRVDKEYIHSHVLRKVISEVWGDEVLGARPTQGTDFTKQYTASLNETWKTEDLALVVTVVNASTKEVLQAAYAHLK